MSEPVVSIDWIGGNCPVQAEGTVDGVPFYFRARGEHWRMEIGDDNTARQVAGLATDPRTDLWEYGERYSDEPYKAGWMTEDEARDFIARAAVKWREHIGTHTTRGSAPRRTG